MLSHSSAVKMGYVSPIGFPMISKMDFSTPSRLNSAAWSLLKNVVLKSASSTITPSFRWFSTASEVPARPALDLLDLQVL